MRLALPHSLGKEELLRRIKSRQDEIAGLIPGGMAEVAVNWPHDDRMTMEVTAMGKTILGRVDIAESEVAFEIDLPGALSFAEPMVRSAMEQKAQKLLA